jgi:hypothetical protein
MKVRLRSIAEADAAEAMRWYAEQKPGLDSRFFEAPEPNRFSRRTVPRIAAAVLLLAEFWLADGRGMLWLR